MVDQFTSEERGLINRLQNAPQPNLSADRFEVIRAQVLQAMDAPPLPPPHAGVSPIIPLIGAGVVVVVITIIIIVSGALYSQNTPPTYGPSQAAPTAEPTPDATAESTLEVTPEVTAEVTIEATVESTAEATAESTEEAIIVIEGPIESINGNIITIYDVSIEIDPNDPVLDVIQVGDVIQVEGQNGDIITAISVIVVNVEVNTNPTSGEIWRDDGTCANPPPDWAPANGWRRRCQGQPQSQGNGNNGMGMGDD